jgi:UDP:flavonoid glycosyltransferase YjiC (YdhE family)
MRVLMTTTRGEGHLRPLLPFADAFREQGHDVLIAAPESTTEAVLDAGHEAWALPEAPAAVSDAVSARAHAAEPEEANRIVVGELFAGVHARAALPGVMGAVAEWQPDALMHETCEFTAALVAERAALPSVRVAVHMAHLEAYIARYAAASVDALRAEVGVEADPDGDRLLAGPSVTLTPPALDGGVTEGHYREPVTALEIPPGARDPRPLVYVSFGTVAPRSGAYPGAYRDAIEQLSALDVRVLLNTGRQDPAELGPLPAGVHARRWVREAQVLPHVSAMVSHAGAGSVRTALAAGVPMALAPRFGDQPLNARAVQEAGAGLIVERPDRIGPTVKALLTDPAYATTAVAIATEVDALPAAGEAIDVLQEASGFAPWANTR